MKTVVRFFVLAGLLLTDPALASTVATGRATTTIAGPPPYTGQVQFSGLAPISVGKASQPVIQPPPTSGSGSIIYVGSPISTGRPSTIIVFPPSVLGTGSVVTTGQFVAP